MLIISNSPLTLLSRIISIFTSLQFLLIKCPICNVDNKIRKDKEKFVCTNCENICIVEKLKNKDSSFANVDDQVIKDPKTGNYHWKAYVKDPGVDNMKVARIPEESPNLNLLKNNQQGTISSPTFDSSIKDIFLRSPEYYQKAYINPKTKVYHPPKYQPENVLNPILGEKSIFGFYDPLRYRLMIEDQLRKNEKLKKMEFGVMLREKRIQDMLTEVIYFLYLIYLLQYQKSLENINDYLANYENNKYKRKEHLLKEYEHRKDIRDYYDNQNDFHRSLEANKYKSPNVATSMPNFNRFNYIPDQPFIDYTNNKKIQVKKYRGLFDKV